MRQAARGAALDLIDAVVADRRLLSDLLPGAVADLTPQDRARAQRLAVETLRWADRADRMLGPFLRKKPTFRVLNALRLGSWEICGDGAPPHAAVSAIVDIIKSNPESRGHAGLVNAILRRISEAGPALWDALPLPRLPRRLRRKFREAWGRETVIAIEEAHAAGAPLDLTPRDGNADDLARRLGGLVLPTGSVRLPQRGQVTALEGFAEGDWWVQDAAAAIPVRLASPRPGERALDLCAAPGGKTLQLAAAGADVTAVDISAQRAERLSENLDRCRLQARVVVADAADWDETGFDIVLLDAPCSATGTIRRHPDLMYAKDLSDIGPLLDLQSRLLDRALSLLAPGGRLVLCTCSLLPEEGEAQVAAALTRHPALRVAPSAVAGADAWGDGAGGIRTRPDFWPERGGIDGFHMARLVND